MEPLSITRRIEASDVLWRGVEEILVGRLRWDKQKAEKKLVSFRRRFLFPYNLYWLCHQTLNEADNSIAMAICECHGADKIVLSGRGIVDSPVFSASCRQVVALKPGFRKEDRGNSRLLIEFGLRSHRFVVDGVFPIILVYLAGILLALLSYILVAGLLLYSLAVFVAFLWAPVDVTYAATRVSHIGLALLCFLVCLAALTGKAWRNIAGLIGLRKKK